MEVLHINQMAIFRTKQKDSSRNLGGKSSLGARLRTRKVTGRDASLPAPLLSAFEMLVARGTVGALPQTPQGTLSLDPARGRRKGTKSPLDPFSRLSWSRFHAPSACSFLALRLSPWLLPQLSVKNQQKSRPQAAFCCDIQFFRFRITSPISRARTASSVRFLKPVFSSMLRMCVLTVATDMCSRSAIS